MSHLSKKEMVLKHRQYLSTLTSLSKVRKKLREDKYNGKTLVRLYDILEKRRERLIKELYNF